MASTRRRRRPLTIAATALAAAGVIVATNAFSVDQHGARVYQFAVNSRFVARPLQEVVVAPPATSGAGRPLLVFLHGFGAGREHSYLDSPMFTALAAQGARAPDIVFPDGGIDSYWHNRADGRWASYVLDEVIPRAIALVHADPRRVAIGGISMGGFGALDMARLHPGRFCAIGGTSAAVWSSGGETPLGAFDDAADFARHDVMRAARAGNPYGSTPVWIDVGTQDSFRAADTTLAQALRDHGANVQLHVWPGGHDGTYWDAHWSSYLAFYAGALAGCRAG